LAKAAIVLIHGAVGWALCGATMGIGMSAFSMRTALAVHAVAAPVIFGVVAFYYFKRYRFTTPLQTAVAFLAIIVALDVLIVALMINKSFEMFTSPIGTWIPILLIGVTTYLVGVRVTR
jgi:hypothetical protein